MLDKFTIIRSMDATHSSHEPNMVMQTANNDAEPRLSRVGHLYPAIGSIVAKHHRDCLMIAYDGDHPGYGWSSNKGYATPDHRAALIKLGPTPLHRRSFEPVAQLMLAL